VTDKTLCDEVAALTETVRELRDREMADVLRDLRAEVERLRADRATHHCTGCSCMHIHYYQQPCVIPGCAPVIPQVWCGNLTSGPGSNSVSNFSSLAAGGVSTYQVALSN